MEIPAGLPWDFGTDEFHDLVQKSPGPNLGLTWLDRAKPAPPASYNSLPHDLVSQIVTIDLVFANWDRSMRSGNLLEDRARRHWIVDHGSCRFLFQPVAGTLQPLPPDRAFAGWEEAFDPRWLRPVSPALIVQTTAEIPDEWLAETRLTRDDIARAIDDRLGRRP
ncbi:MAG: hypothetical protein ACREIA_12730 [Opitutaceae bacterium]